MNRILLLILCLIFHLPNHAQILNENAFQGSLLCNQRILRVTQIPDIYKSHALVKKEISLYNIPNNVIKISYFLETESVRAIVTDTSDLSSYFPAINELRSFQPYPHWNLREYYYIDNKLLDSTSQYGSPYGDCYTFKPTKCAELTVYRHSLQEMCPSFHTKIMERSYQFQNPNLEAIFIDTLIQQPYVCAGIGWSIKTDSVVVPGIHVKLGLAVNVSYKSISKSIMACVNTPCPQFIESKGFIGSITPYSLCLINNVSNSETHHSWGRIYPNPATGSVNLPEGVSLITLTDSKGRQQILKGTGNIPLGNIVPGIYAVSYNFEGRLYNARLVVY